MNKIVAGAVIYGAVFGVMWKFFIHPVCKTSQKEDEWLEWQLYKSQHENKIAPESGRTETMR